MVRHSDHTGEAADIALTHYFTRNLGFTADGDLLKSNYQDFREYGYRFGPTLRLVANRRLQLFTRGLFGYARFKDGLTGPHRPYEDGFSYTLGGGADTRIAGPLSVRVSGDFEDCTGASSAATPTRYLRIGFGFKYGFGSSAY